MLATEALPRASRDIDYTLQMKQPLSPPHPRNSMEGTRSAKACGVLKLACFICGSVTREEPACSVVDNVYFTFFYFIFRLVDILITISDLAWAPRLLSEMN